MMRQIPRHLDLDRVENEAEAAAVPAEDKKKDEKKGHRLRWIWWNPMESLGGWPYLS